jgi:hypothetical protein
MLMTFMPGPAMLPPASAFLGMQALAGLVLACWEYAGLRASSGMQAPAAAGLQC